jgi:hypothetical protein
MAQKRDGSAGNPAQASPELRRQCGGLVMVMKRRHREDLAAVVFELGGRGKVEGWVRGEPAGGRGGVSSFHIGWRVVGEAMVGWQWSA